MPIDRRDPVLELLRRGDLLAASPLRYRELLDLLREALHDRLPAYARRDPEEPGNALLAAFAAAIDTFGFHHDRFLTESKLASAQTLRAVTRLAAAVGYRPRPPIAATAFQHFVARARGILPAGTAISGLVPGQSGNVQFETRHALELGPAFNRMRLAPVIAAHTGSRHAVLAGRDLLTPLDDFFHAALALVTGDLGAELLAVATARRRAVAFQRGLRRSYHPGDPTGALHEGAAVTAATQVRRLTNWTLYDHPEQDATFAVAELSRDPILHLRDDRPPGAFKSSLELHVFEPTADPGDPARWNPEARWTEVPDFADSEADDPHFRLIVDDRMRTYVLLRLRLGHRHLLGARPVKSGNTTELRCDRLAHVYARFTPALGQIPREADSDESAIVTLQFCRKYYDSPIVTRKALKEELQVTGKRANSDWAILDRAADLEPGDQIIVEDAENQALHIRTLSAVDGPYISWAKEETPKNDGPADDPEPNELWNLLLRYHPDYEDIVADVIPASPMIANLEDGKQTEPDQAPEYRREVLSRILGPRFVVNVFDDIEHGRGISYTKFGKWPGPRDIWIAGAPIPAVELKKTRIMPLPAAVAENSLQFWADYYHHIQIPDYQPLPSTLPPEALKAITDGDRVELVALPRGELYLLLESTANLKPGDYFLLGKRLRLNHREDPLAKIPLDNDAPNQQIVPHKIFDPGWLNAEVLQAVEVHGKVVRLKYPTQNEYKLDFELWKGTKDVRVKNIITELVVVPNVSSVYFGDQFAQTVELSISRTLAYAVEPAQYVEFGLDPQINADDQDPPQQSLRQSMGWDKLSREEAFQRVFLGFSNQVSPLTKDTWKFAVLLRREDLSAALLDSLSQPKNVQLVAEEDVPQGVLIEVDAADFAAIHASNGVLARLTKDLAPAWDIDVQTQPSNPGEFRVLAFPGGKVDLPSYLAAGATLLFLDGPSIVLETTAAPLDPPQISFQGLPPGNGPWTLHTTPGFVALEGMSFLVDEKIALPHSEPADDASLLVFGTLGDPVPAQGFELGPDTVEFTWRPRFANGAVIRPDAVALIPQKSVAFDDTIARATWNIIVSKDLTDELDAYFDDKDPPKTGLVVRFEAPIDGQTTHRLLDVTRSQHTQFNQMNLTARAAGPDTILDLRSAKIDRAFITTNSSYNVEIKEGNVTFPKGTIPKPVSHVLLYVKGGVEPDIFEAEWSDEKTLVVDPKELKKDYETGRWAHVIPSATGELLNGGTEVKSVNFPPPLASYSHILVHNGSIKSAHELDVNGDVVLLPRPPSWFKSVNLFGGAAKAVACYGWTDQIADDLKGAVKALRAPPNQPLAQKLAGKPWTNLLFHGANIARTSFIQAPPLPEWIPLTGLDTAQLKGLTGVGPSQVWGPFAKSDLSWSDTLTIEVAKKPTAGTQAVSLIPGDWAQLAGFATEPALLGKIEPADSHDTLSFFTVAGTPGLKEVRIDRLYCDNDPAKDGLYEATLTFVWPAQKDPPSRYLLWTGKVAPDKIRDSLLLYSEWTEEVQPNESVHVRVGFDSQVAVSRLAALANAGPPSAAMIVNRREMLFEKLYTGTSAPFNFLTNDKPIELLLAAPEHAGQTFYDEMKGHLLFLGSSVADRLDQGPFDAFYEGALTSREVKSMFPRAYAASTTFNSGNFLPIRVPGTEADEIVRNSIKVMVYFEDYTIPVEAVFEGELITKFATMEAKQQVIEGELCFYDYNKSNEGTFTLNILVLSALEASPTRVEVHVSYAATFSQKLEAHIKAVNAGEKDDEDPDASTELQPHDPLYEFETHAHVLSPLRNLIVLDPLRLKPGDFVFLSTKDVPDAINVDSSVARKAIQWTRVQEIDGRFVAVWPPLRYQPRQIYRYVLGVYRPTATRWELDAEYYRQIHEDGADGVVPLGRSIVFDHDSETLKQLVPGDHLLLWDEAARAGWRLQRAPTDAHDFEVKYDPEDDPDWRTWPEAQHEVVIKQVNHATGLVTLADPLPARFAVRFTVSIKWGTWTHDAGRFRVLPFYREPFQGRRRLQTLGDGDRALRFQRFSTTVSVEFKVLTTPPALGHYSVHGAQDGAFVSNFEVLSFDPRPGEWARWTEFSGLERAQRKDLACTVGVERLRHNVDAGLQLLDLQIGFGDGVLGQRLPSGRDNVLLRWTDTGGLDALLRFAGDCDVRVLAFGAECVPLALDGQRARRKNLRITVAHGGHRHWRPRLAARDVWSPALAVEVLRDGAWVRLPELTDRDAIAGREGYVVRPTDPPRPGVYDVYVCSDLDMSGFVVGDDPQAAQVRVRDLAQSLPWRLDRGFYDDLLADDLTLAPGASRVPFDETEGLRDGAWLAYYPGERADEAPELVRAVAVDHDTFSASVAPALGRVYDLERSHLLGNIVEVDQGKRDTYTVGSGDSSARSLRLSLFNRAPLIHRLGADADPEPWLELLVDGVPWRRVADFEDAGPHDRVYRLDIEPDGHAFVVFGDGVRGQIPPSGRDNIEARVHLGDGALGNLPAGAIDTVRDGHLAVKATRNITASTGGLAAEDAAAARGSLLARGPLTGRAVTVDDLARVARGLGDILHAELDPLTDHRTCRLVLALQGRRRPDLAGEAELRRRLLAQLPAAAGVTLELRLARAVPVHIVLDVDIADGYREGEVLAAIEAGFAASGDGFFAAERWPIGAMLRLSDLYERLFAVPGVAAGTVLWMRGELPPLKPSAAPVELIDPGPDGQIYCEPGRPLDTHPERGSLVVQIHGGAA